MKQPDLFLYSGHEWRAVVIDGRASDTQIICAECGLKTTIGHWPEQRCHARFAPLAWQPRHIQDAVKIDRIRRPNG